MFVSTSRRTPYPNIVGIQLRPGRNPGSRQMLEVAGAESSRLEWKEIQINSMSHKGKTPTVYYNNEV